MPRLLTVLKITAAASMFGLLFGCATYQPGDGLGTVTQYQLKYCATADPYQRSIAIAMLQRAGAPLPDSGVCTDLARLIVSDKLPEVDTTTAEANQEWARKQLEGGE